MSKDYYKILGVNKDASKEEIKRAYRELAQKHHPDKAGDEQLFKEAKDAYEILSDDTKRKQYDAYGHSGPQPQHGGFGYNDAFSSFFRQSTSQIQQVVINLTLLEAIQGCTKTIQRNKQHDCPDCTSTQKSNLSKDDKKKDNKCPHCKGTGQIKHPFIASFSVGCQSCQGTGKTFDKDCKICRGSGKYSKVENSQVNILPGIQHGAMLQSDDLIIIINILPHDVYQRNGNDLHREIEIDAIDAILGTSVQFDTITGDKLSITIPAGTWYGAKLKISGKGIKPDNGPTGNIIVHIKVTKPILDDNQKEILKTIKL